MPVVKIKEFSHPDFRALRSFKCESPGEDYSSRVQKNIREELYREWQNPDQSGLTIYLGINPSDRIDVVGLIAFSSIYGGESLGYIHLLAVTHQWRRRRVATLLKDTALSQMKADGCNAVVSNVAPENTAMRTVNKKWKPQEELNALDQEFLTTTIRLKQADQNS